MPKKILFTNGNYNDIPLIDAAHKFGLYVITTGNDPNAEGHKFSDEYCQCDFTDKEAMLLIAKEKSIDYVCSCGNDLTAITASYISEKLGLPGHDTYNNCRVFHEKDEFKKIVRRLGLTSPHSELFNSKKDAKEYLKKATFPQIVKPVDMGGGKGISVAHDITEGEKSINYAFDKSKNKHIVIENYIDGTQHGFICYVKDGKVVFDYSTNDYSYLNPFMVWIATGYPADGYLEVRNQIIKDVELIAKELKIADGFLTIQYMMHNDRAYYLETMRRCLGNMHFKCISRDVGINLYDLFVATECGFDCSEYISSIHETGLKSGFMGIYASENGVFDDIVIDAEFEKYVYEKMMLYSKGQQIDDYLGEKLGIIWFSFNSNEERTRIMSKKEKLVKVNLS